MPKIPDKNFFRPYEVAGILDESVDTIRRWTRQGLIKGFRVPGRRHVKIPREEVVRLTSEMLARR